jgi:uncharacterized damage-inducible protein DinB
MKHPRFNLDPALYTATLAVAILVLAGPAAGQQTNAHAGHAMSMPEEGVRAELIQDLDQLEEKYLALSEAMAGEYLWRPADGVRSVSEVFMHVAASNFMIPAMAGIDPPSSLPGGSAAAMEGITDPAEVQDALAHSIRHVRHAIARTPDAELDADATLFGRESTKRAVLMLLVTHMHEHLGQSVAYARTVGVTPPWSGGG